MSRYLVHAWLLSLAGKLFGPWTDDDAGVRSLLAPLCVYLRKALCEWKNMLADKGCAHGSRGGILDAGEDEGGGFCLERAHLAIQTLSRDVIERIATRYAVLVTQCVWNLVLFWHGLSLVSLRILSCRWVALS